MTWYVVRTKPRQERRALVNLTNQQMVAFLPELTVHKLRRGKRTAVTEPLFPGYLFVNCDDYAEHFYKIRNSYGVSKLLTFGAQVATVPDALIMELQQLQEDALLAQKLTAAAMPQVGDKVEIQAGPFAGFIAKIIGLDGDSRCIVLLNWLQQEVQAIYSFDEISRK